MIRAAPRRDSDDQLLGRAIRLKHHPENVPIMTLRRPGRYACMAVDDR